MERVLYATRTRRIILAILRSDNRLFTASELFERVAEQRSGVAMSTIYRTLELLESIGTVARHTNADKDARYVYCGEAHHHHAVCRECGHVDDVACPVLDAIKESLARQCGFELDEHEIEFYGRCAACRRAARRSRSD